MKNISWKKIIFSISSFVFKRNFFGFVAEFLMQSWQKRSLYVQMNYSWKFFLEKLILLNVYGFWAISFWDLFRISNRNAKTAHYMLGESFEEKQLFQKKSFAELFLDCERNVFGWTFEKTSEVSSGNFSRKKICS